jgi:hypothetical protein
MKTTIVCCSLLVVAACLASPLLWADTRVSAKGANLGDYATMTRHELVQSLGKASEEKINLENEIVESLKSNQPHEKMAAIFLSGIYRVPEAAPQLARMIDFRDPQLEDDRKMSLWDQYPAAQALASIGIPAVSHMVGNLATGDDVNVRELSARVLRVVLGRDLAREAVRLAIEKNRGDQKKVVKLQDSLSYFED